MARFNKDGAVVYNTYQMYVLENRSSSGFTDMARYLMDGVSKMKRHMDIAREKDFIIGLKLVRGAFLHTDPDVEAFSPSKQSTDENYDTGVKFLLGEPDTPAGATGKPWSAEVMLATHNQASVDSALSLWRSKTPKEEANGGVKSLAFAQLMGMADEVSLGLVRERKGGRPVGVYKYTIWGSFEECLLYMLRRAEENRDAVARTRGTAWEVVREVGRRVFFV